MLLYTWSERFDSDKHASLMGPFVSYEENLSLVTALRGQDRLVKMMSSGGKLIVLAGHPTKKVNKAEELTYLSENILL